MFMVWAHLLRLTGGQERAWSEDDSKVYRLATASALISLILAKEPSRIERAYGGFEDLVNAKAISSAADISSSGPSLATSPSVSIGGGASTPCIRTHGKQKHQVVNPRPTKKHCMRTRRLIDPARYPRGLPPPPSLRIKKRRPVFESLVSTTSFFAAENIAYPPSSPSKNRRPHLDAGSPYSAGVLEPSFMKKLAHEMQKWVEEVRRKRSHERG
ncbi:hypothetical protein HOY82DRAFT_598049 [Tuber indicum]|nr:hypothetical protein HOY82DRAFT_598049 [Tuber indicum]